MEGVGWWVNWSKSRKVLFGALSQDQNFRRSLLPSATPDIVKSLIEVLPSDVLKVLGFGVGFGPDVVNQPKQTWSKI